MVSPMRLGPSFAKPSDFALWATTDKMEGRRPALPDQVETSRLRDYA